MSRSPFPTYSAAASEVPSEVTSDVPTEVSPAGPFWSSLQARYVVYGQQRTIEGMLDYYERVGIANGVSIGEGNYVEFRSTGVIGTSDLTRGFVIVITCQTAAIVSHIKSPFGLDSPIVAERQAADQCARDALKTLAETIIDCQDTGHFGDQSAAECYIIGIMTDGGRIERSMNDILKQGLIDMNLTPRTYDYMEPLGSTTERPGLGSVLVLDPEITRNVMPEIYIDDEIKLKDLLR